MKYIWNSASNSFETYEQQYETTTNEQGEEVKTPISPLKKVYTQQEVDTLFASVGKNQVIKSVQGQPRVVDLFTQEEMQTKATVSRIAELKQLLASTDYQAIKFAEGEMTDEEYASIKEQRRSWRAEINELIG